MTSAKEHHHARQHHRQLPLPNMIRFEIISLFAHPIAVVFDAERNVDLHLQSQSAHQEKVVDGCRSGLIGLHEEVEWEAIHFGIRQRLRSRITAFDAPHHFCDEQVRGAFRSFRHEHHFLALAPDLTQKRDLIIFSAPCGPLGLLAERLILRPYLRRLISRKNTALAQALSSGTEKGLR